MSDGPGSIVVATDFTPHAREAVARATWLPHAPRCSVTLVHAVPPGLPAPIESRLRPATAARMNEARAAAVAGAQRAGLGPVEISTVIESGRAAERVIEHARARRADLIVVGRGEHPRTDGRLLGSTAEQIVRGAACSVLVVASPPAGPYRRALVGIDRSDMAVRAVQAAARFAPGPDALTLVHAFRAPFADMTPDRFAPPMTPAEIEAYYADAERAARTHLEHWIAGVGLTQRPLLVRGDPRRVLLEQAAERGAELIAVGHHDRSVLGHLLLGSVATAVVRAAGCDVLVVR